MKTPWQKGQGRKEADQMEVIIKGEAQEIAALVLAVQERRGQPITMDPKSLLQAICNGDQKNQ